MEIGNWKFSFEIALSGRESEKDYQPPSCD
jgi:hypothetical protein